MKVALDAGHSLNTPGKRTPDGMHEWSFNSVVASYIANELKGYIDVETLRTDDITGAVDVSLSERADKANKWGADAYISIHANALGTGGWNTASGIETFTYPTAARQSFVLAKLVQEELIKATKRSDRGIKTANFAVLRSTNMPAILVECGFMTNKEEAALLKSDSYRKTCASAIVKGIVTMYGLKKKEVVAEDQGVSSWAVAARKWVKEQGISNGADPKEPATREQVWTMLYRSAGSPKI